MGLGAAVATGTALLTNYALENFRKAVVDWSGLHDYTVAMMEDQICVGLCVAVANAGPKAHAANGRPTTHATESQTTPQRSEQYA